VKVWEAIFVTLIGAALAEQAPPPQLTEDQRKAQELLKKTIEERQKNHPQAQTNAMPRLTQAEIEQQYLAGKITAKQFQQYLRQQPGGKPQLAPEKQAEALQMLRVLTGKTNTPPPAVGKAALPPADVPPEPATPAIVDVESKIRELEKLKEAREKASGTNAPSAAAPKNKREKLDALLKQFVEGKITDADYKAERGKIISGPD
jgi:hypothetical protein